MDIQSNNHVFIWLEQILQDIRFSLRSLRKRPGFTAVAVLSLALAIGVNSGVFSIVNAVLFKPLISLRPNEVVSVYTISTEVNPISRKFTFPEFSLLRESDEVFADVAAIQTAKVYVGANTNAEMKQMEGFVVSDNYFSMLGVTPAMGRFFLPEESKPNANIPVAVVSQSMWKSLGGGNDLSERTVNINGEVYAIVGVAPKGFSGTTLYAPEVWLPMGMSSSFLNVVGERIADNLYVGVIARLQPGLTLKAAKARLPVLADRLAMIAVDATEGARTLEIGPPSRFSIGLAEPDDSGLFSIENLYLALVFVMPGVVLLVACLNLANMFLARNTMRSEELAVRLALGASRRRVVRILSVEGLIIALMGGAVGLVLSHWANRLLLGSLTRASALSSTVTSLSLDTTPDIRVLLATLLFCMIATLIFALTPAWHTTRDIARGSFSLQRSTRTTTDRWGRLFSGRHCLLMAQLALSLALLFFAGLAFRAAHSAARLDLGFEPEGGLIAEIDYTLLDRDEAGVRTSTAALVDELRANPDIRKVALASGIPFVGGIIGFPVSTVGATEKQARHAEINLTAVSRDYFDTLGVKLLRGRDFTDQECLQTEGPLVVIIDQGTASALFPGEDPVGKYITPVVPSGPPGLPGPPGADALPGLGAGEATASEPMQIVGVVSAHRSDVNSDSPPFRLFSPLAKQSRIIDSSLQRVFVLMRGQTTMAVTSSKFRELVRSKLSSLDPGIPLVRLTPYTDILDGDITMWKMRFIAVLFGVFGAIALLLAVIGVYGVKAFLVARRMREIGIRMALGASRRRIYALLMKQSAVQITIGMCVGLILCLIAGRLLAVMLRFQGMSPGDPLVFVLAALVLSLAALLATWLPARRAAKVEPMEVLRWE